MDDPILITTDRFKQGFSCSQSLFSAFAPQFGLSSEIASRIASPFGGGIARQGDTCGAVTGALMALALKYGPGIDETNNAIYQVSQEFLHRFKSKHAYIQCRQLIDFDLSHPAELEAARKSKVFNNICPLLVRTAAEIVRSMLDSDSSSL